MADPDPGGGADFMSSRFSGGGNCVEVARGGDGLVLVQDSKDRGHRLRFTSAEWRAFVAGVKAGEFDHLL